MVQQWKRKSHFFLPEGELEQYGVNECKEIMQEASKKAHVQASGINFDSRMAHLYMSLIKKAIMEGVWNRICPEWFEAVDDKSTKPFVDVVSLVELFQIVISNRQNLTAFFLCISQIGQFVM